jgi:5-methylcytosine-specific restriction endonuclease McrA
LTEIKLKRIKAPKTRNSATMTEAAFWQFIRSVLRQKSRWWKPISECKQLVRRKYRGSNRRQKWEYQCAECKGWFSDKEIAVDHIKPAGSLSKPEDLAGFVSRLFCEVDGLQVLCDKHHDAKTIIDKEMIKQSKLI